MVAMNFRCACFLPESFIAYAMESPFDNFGRKVANRVEYAQSNNVDAMACVSGYIVPYGTSAIGQSSGFCFTNNNLTA